MTSIQSRFDPARRSDLEPAIGKLTSRWQASWSVSVARSLPQRSGLWQLSCAGWPGWVWDSQRTRRQVAFHDLAVGDFPFEPVFMSNIQNSTFNCTHMVRMPLSVKSRFRKRNVEPAPGPGEVTSLSGDCVNCGWSPPSCPILYEKSQ